MARLTVGLTGGVASGKSLVASYFEALAVPVLDADQVARDVVIPGSPALAQIAAEFGAGILQTDGSLDRRRLRERVFQDAEARRRLEAITHPAIRARLVAWRDAQTAPYCILSVAILVEARMTTLVDRVLVVDVTEQTQLDRLVARDGIAPALAQAMLAAQASRAQRLAAAHDVLENLGSPEAARSAVSALHARYLALAATAPERRPS